MGHNLQSLMYMSRLGPILIGEYILFSGHNLLCAEVGRKMRELRSKRSSDSFSKEDIL